MNKLKKRMRAIAMFSMAIIFSAAFVACEKDDDNGPDNEDNGDNGSDETLYGEISGTLAKGTYVVSGDLIVPEGEELILEPGVILAFDGDGLSPETSPEIQLLGNLVAIGTPEDPIMFTVVEERRDPANAYAGLWGGIQAMSSCEHLILKHTIIEYSGGPARQSEAYDAGDPRYTIHFANPEGVFVFKNSIIRNLADDGIRPQGGGRMAIINNIFYNIGETGGEGLNIKDGSVGVVAYNLFYAMATNGSKPAGEGDGVPQTNIDTYNNTFINNGFRRAQAGRGGSIKYEQGARGQVYNNLIVNCRFGVRMRGDRLPDMDNIEYDYTHYFAYDETDQENFWPTTDLDDDGNTLTYEKPGDIIQQDPLFVNYDVNTDKMNPIPDNSWNFHLTGSSPGLTAGTTDFEPVISSLSAGGVTIIIPGPSVFIGAYGAE